MYVSLVNAPAWKIVDYVHSCPNIQNSVIPAGTYNFSIFFYINTPKNYTGSNFAKKIEFHVFTGMNTPQYKSNVFTLNLLTNKTSSILNTLSTNDLVITLSSLIILPSIIYSIVKFSPSFRKYLHNKFVRAKNPSHSLLNDKTFPFKHRSCSRTILLKLNSPVLIIELNSVSNFSYFIYQILKCIINIPCLIFLFQLNN